jgi:hypothetical protein
MMRKSGLHKKVSSIFGDVPVVGNPPVRREGSGAEPKGEEGHNAPAIRVVGPDRNRKLEGDIRPFAQVSKSSRPVDAFEEEYRIAQKRKLILVIALAVVFGLVMYFVYVKPAMTNKATVPEERQEEQAVAAKMASEIVWPAVEPWPKDVRDPMLYTQSDEVLNVDKANAGELLLKGVVYKPGGKSSVLIGKEILYVGEEVQGWKIVEVSRDSVKLENGDGEKMELRMKNR